MQQDINPIKLKRITDFLQDDGTPAPDTFAKLLSAQPSNVQWLRAYAEAAANILQQPEVLTDFDANAAKAGAEPAPDMPTPEPTPKAVAKAAGTPAPAGDVIESVPEAELPKKAVAAVPAPAVTLEGPLSGYEFRYRGKDGIATPLQVLTQQGKTLILEAQPQHETVNVKLRGQTVTLNLTELRLKPAGETVNTEAGPFTVAVLLTIGEAAK